MTGISDAEFIRLCADSSLTTNQIAEISGLSPQWVGTRLRRLGLPKRPRGPSGPVVTYDQPRLIQMWRAGVSVADIKAHLSVSDWTVRNCVARNKLPSRGKGVDYLPLADFLDLYPAAKPAEAVSVTVPGDQRGQILATKGRYAALAAWAAGNQVTLARAQQLWHQYRRAACLA